MRCQILPLAALGCVIRGASIQLEVVFFDSVGHPGRLPLVANLRFNFQSYVYGIVCMLTLCEYIFYCMYTVRRKHHWQ